MQVTRSTRLPPPHLVEVGLGWVMMKTNAARLKPGGKEAHLAQSKYKRPILIIMNWKVVLVRCHLKSNNLHHFRSFNTRLSARCRPSHVASEDQSSDRASGEQRLAHLTLLFLE